MCRQCRAFDRHSALSIQPSGKWRGWPVLREFVAVKRFLGDRLSVCCSLVGDAHPTKNSLLFGRFVARNSLCLGVFLVYG